jgi:hypothetical protein
VILHSEELTLRPAGRTMRKCPQPKLEAILHFHYRLRITGIMEIKRKSSLLWGVFGLIFFLTATWFLTAQQTAPSTDKDHAQTPSNPLAELSPENRALFDALREAVKRDNLTDILANGRILLPALKPGNVRSDAILKLTTQAALETGDTNYALTLIKPLAELPPTDWVAAELLARLYAESENKELRDRQITHLLDLHSHTSDKQFAEQLTFTIQKIKLHSGYAILLYPFKPLKPYNAYLSAEIWTNENKMDYRIELESMGIDQLLFKAKKSGERRFSIDTFVESKKGEKQTLIGFIDGVFDYDTMRDKMLEVANQDKSSQK